MTPRQCLVFDKALSERRKHENISDLLIQRAAHHADPESFQGLIRSLEGRPDPATLDFSEG